MEHCVYCETTKGLRVVSPAYTHRGKTHPPDWICEACFTPQDEGPTFDDLPASDRAHDPIIMFWPY
jgi:hypothetical protein